ncbi:SHOCT domain-containing protein [Pelovirga terrestris]|nr:SHOCT domain-containing protein [Pelovirga terrestris]
MGPEHFGWGGWWIFPTMMPLLMIVVVVAILYFILGRGGPGPPWWHDSGRSSGPARDAETAIEVLKKRYAKGEITREEFEQIKNDLQS